MCPKLLNPGCLLELIIFLAVFGLAIYFYIKAKESRKVYVCPECKESFRVELMKASHCKVCGAPVNLTDDLETTDGADD